MPFFSDKTIKIISRVVLAGISLFIVFFIISWGYVYNNKDKFQEQLTFILNETFYGKWEIDKVSLNPFVHFPAINLTIKGLKLYELSDQEPVIKADENSVSVNIFTLLKKEHIIKNIRSKNISLNITEKSNGEINLIQLLQFRNKKLSDTGLKAEIEKLSAQNVSIKYLSERNGQRFSLFFPITELYIGTGDSLIYTQLNSELNIDSINSSLLPKFPVVWQGKLIYNREKQLLSIDNNTLNFANTEIRINGTTSLKYNGHINLQITSQLDDVKSVSYRKNKGIIYVPNGNGQAEIALSLSGTRKSPVFDGKITADNLTVQVEKTNKKIHRINLDLAFHSQNFPEKIDSINIARLTASTDSSYINLSFKAKNTQPIEFYSNSRIQLEEFSEIIGIGTEKIGGNITLLAEKKQNTSSQKNIFSLVLEKIYFHSSCPFFSLNNVSGYFTWENNRVVGNNIQLHLDNDSLYSQLRFPNINSYLSGSDTRLDIETDISIPRLTPKHLLERVGLTMDTLNGKQIIQNIHFNASTSLDIKRLITQPTDTPEIEIEIKNLNAVHPALNRLHDFSGTVVIINDSLTVKELKGYIGKSDITINLNYRNFLKSLYGTENLDNITIPFHIESSFLYTNDLPISENSLLPFEYIKNKQFRNFNITGIGMIYPNTVPLNYISNFSLQVSRLHFQTVAPSSDANITFDIERKNDKFLIRSLSGKLDDNNFQVNGGITASSDNKNITYSGTLNINSNNLYIKEIKYKEINQTVPMPHTDSESNITDNFFNLPIPAVSSSKTTDKRLSEINLNINIVKLEYPGLILDSLTGAIQLTNNALLLKRLTVKNGKGNIRFNGTLKDNKRQNGFILDSDISLNNISLQNLGLKLNIDKKNMKQIILGEHFKGLLNGNMNVNIALTPDFEIIAPDIVADMELSIDNGAIADFAPFSILAKYFKRHDINNIRFAKLKNRITIKNGVLHIPRMNIPSTLGNFFIEGEQTLFGEMDYNVEVPWAVISEIARTTIFGSSPNKTEEEEIAEMIRKHYINLNITGTINNFKISPARKKKF